MKNGFQKRIYKTQDLEEISYLDSAKNIPKYFSSMRLHCYEETRMAGGAQIEIRQPGLYWGLHFVTEGSAELQCEGSTFKLRRGNLFFNRSGKVLTLRVPKGETFRKTTLLILYSNALETLCGPFKEIESDIFFLKQTHRFEKYLGSILSAILHGHEHIRHELSILVYSCLTELDHARLPSEKELASIIRETVYRNPAQFGNIDNLAKEAGMSRRSLFRFFREKYSCTPMQYVIRARLERSRWYLNCYMGMPIAEVARLCGYKSSGFFSKEFKKYYLFTPNEYRKEHRDPNLSVN